MNDLYLTPVGMEQRQDPYELIIPESFEEALTYEEQILWLLAHKQDLLVEGDNITLTPNEDGTVTISSEGGQGATYRIETATPDEGYTAAYILKNVDTEEQAGVKIQVPTVAGPQGPEGPAGQDGQDGVGISDITSQHVDVYPDVYGVVSGSQYPAGRNSLGTNAYLVSDQDVSVFGSDDLFIQLYSYDYYNTTIEFTVTNDDTIDVVVNPSMYVVEDRARLVLLDSDAIEVAEHDFSDDTYDRIITITFGNLAPGTYTLRLEDAGNDPVKFYRISSGVIEGHTNVTVEYTNGDSDTFSIPDGERGEIGPAGPAGATGATGPQGPAGVGITSVTSARPNDDYIEGTVPTFSGTVNLPANSETTWGNVVLKNKGSGSVQITNSAITADGRTYTSRLYFIGYENGTPTMNAVGNLEFDVTVPTQIKIIANVSGLGTNAAFKIWNSSNTLVETIDKTQFTDYVATSVTTLPIGHYTITIGKIVSSGSGSGLRAYVYSIQSVYQGTAPTKTQVTFMKSNYTSDVIYIPDGSAVQP